jgi:hypothetical protein
METMTTMTDKRQVVLEMFKANRKLPLNVQLLMGMVVMRGGVMQIAETSDATIEALYVAWTHPVPSVATCKNESVCTG